MNFSRSMIDNSQELAIIKRKLWDQGSKFSHEIRIAKLLALSTTTDTILRPLFQQHKKSHDTIRCSSSNQSQVLALVARKFETLGSNFSYETRKARLLASSATTNTILTHPIPIIQKEPWIFPVAWLIIAKNWLLSKENFETKAQSLAMKPQVCWRPLLLLKNSWLTPKQKTRLNVFHWVEKKRGLI